MKFFPPQIAIDIRAQALTSEQERCLSRSVLDFIIDQRLFKLFVPAQLNGAMLGLPRAARIFEEASYIDGSFGWLVTIGAGGGYFSAFFDPEVAKRLYTPVDAVVSGSGHPSGIAYREDGGYRVSGSWRYCSGADYATIFTANALMDGNPEQLRSFVFTLDQVKVNDDWDTFGLKATTGHTISVEDIFVPDSMTFEISSETRFPDPIFRYPFLQFAEASFAAVCIGISQHFIDEAIATIQPYGDDETTLSSGRYAAVNKQIAEQKEITKKAVEDFHEVLALSWEALLLSGDIPESMLADVSRIAKNAASVSLRSAQNIYPYLGLAVARESTMLNKCWRDLHTASQHILLRSFEEVV